MPVADFFADSAFFQGCAKLVIRVFTVYTDYKDMEVYDMAVKAMNFKMDEADIRDMKAVAGVYNMSVTDLIKNAVKEYMDELKKDPFYRLTTNVQEASAEESGEILSAIAEMSEDDLKIASAKRFNG